MHRETVTNMIGLLVNLEKTNMNPLQTNMNPLQTNMNPLQPHTTHTQAGQLTYQISFYL